MSTILSDKIKDYKFFTQHLVIAEAIADQGLTLEDFKWVHKTSPDVCPICGKPVTRIHPDFCICLECIKTHAFCFSCATWHPIKDIMELNDIPYCKKCRKNIKTHQCSICGAVVTEDVTHTDVHGHTYVCDKCYNTKVTKCSVCQKKVLKTDIKHCGGCNRDMCTDCYNHPDHIGCESATYKIRSYHDIPVLIFRNWQNESDRLHMGFELELELTNIDRAFNIIKGSKFIWGSQDSSISHGLEFITHPSTLNYYHNSEELKVFISKMAQFHNVSVPAQGLHVHIGRDALNHCCYPTLRTLINKNEEFFTKFADRSTRYALFDNENSARTYVYGMSGVARGAFFEGRKNTVEVRIFKGKLDLPFIYSALELCHAMCKFGNKYDKIFTLLQDEHVNMDEVPSTTLNDFLEFIHGNPELYTNAINRITTIGVR